jgi:hypothetical protein
MINSWAFVLAACVLTAGCVPVRQSEYDLIGSWRVEWKCGTEKLELGENAVYTQHINYAAGGTETNSGTWTVATGKSLLSGSKLILKDAVEFCSVFGEKPPQTVRGERQLEAIWEWGRVTLSFNPDSQGFERQ